MSELRELILNYARNGEVVITCSEGLQAAKIEDFVNQPLFGILYDLNRLPEVVLAYVDDPKWVNDYAVYLTIKQLKEDNDRLRSLLQRVEWVWSNTSCVAICPVCHRRKDYGHADDCEYKAVMGEVTP